MNNNFQVDDFVEISNNIKLLTGKDLKDYIIKRLLWLEQNISIQKLGITDDDKVVSVYKGYISSNSPIKSPSCKC